MRQEVGASHSPTDPSAAVPVLSPEAFMAPATFGFSASLITCSFLLQLLPHSLFLIPRILLALSNVPIDSAKL